MALHRAWETDAEWIRRELRWTATRRVPERAPVCQPQRGASDHRRMEDRLQHQPAAFEPEGSHRSSSQHAPMRGKTGTDSPKELDFVPGTVNPAPAFRDQLWSGGLALGVLLPQERTGRFEITARAEQTFKTVRAAQRSLLQRTASRVKRMIIERSASR